MVNKDGNYLFPLTGLDKHLLTVKEASIWATNQFNKNVTTSNISYLIQYGRIKKIDENGNTYVSINDLNNRIGIKLTDNYEIIMDDGWELGLYICNFDIIYNTIFPEVI